LEIVRAIKADNLNISSVIALL